MWPFDGLDVTDRAYAGAHVLIEPYPSSLRPPRTVQSDEADAWASVRQVQVWDAAGALGPLMDLTRLEPADQAMARTEGWIIGHVPWAGAASG